MGRRLGGAVLAGGVGAGGAAAALAYLLPGDPVDRAVIAGLLLPLGWVLAVLRAALAPSALRAWLEPAALGLAGAAVAGAAVVL